MLDTELLSSIAQQMISGSSVEVNGKRIPVRRTSANCFRTLAFEMDGGEYQAINRTRRSPAGGDSWRRRAIKWCSLRTGRQTGLLLLR
jgi:hypothetical protein